ncbi:unnamed protein product, partial [Rotaria sp. Silwood1]
DDELTSENNAVAYDNTTMTPSLSSFELMISLVSDQFYL